MSISSEKPRKVLHPIQIDTMHFRFKPRRNPGSQSQHRSVNRTAVGQGGIHAAVQPTILELRPKPIHFCQTATFRQATRRSHWRFATTLPGHLRHCHRTGRHRTRRRINRRRHGVGRGGTLQTAIFGVVTSHAPASVTAAIAIWVAGKFACATLVTNTADVRRSGAISVRAAAMISSSGAPAIFRRGIRSTAPVQTG